MKASDYKIVRYGGSDYTAHLHISSRYIRGIADGKSWMESTKDELDEQYVFVFVYDHELFLNKLLKKLCELGIKKDEIIYKQIEYIEMDKPFKIKDGHPYELFYKNKQFYDQHEGRVVLNTSNTELINYLLNNPIDIGSLEDVCVLFEQYPAGGIESFIKLDVDE